MVMGASLLVGCGGSAESNSDGGSDSNVAVEETANEETEGEEAVVETTGEETAEENGGKIEVVYDAGAFDAVADEYGASFNVKAVTSADFPVLNEEAGSKGFITYMGDYSAERYVVEYGLDYYENKIEDIGWTAYVCYKISVSGEIEESYWLVEMENGNQHSLFFLWFRWVKTSKLP